ncbi:MAG: HAMP domain-containing histidine kinase [Defluviitaleaceae bacterium]|nr:HAMP domain-containing histidine kinase [Defluviitaleaceae bacterium]
MRIFGRQLFLSLGILVISLAFLGLVLTQVMGGYLTDQRKSALTDSAARVARSVESVLINIRIHGDVNLDPLVTQIENLSDILGASVVIIGPDYEILYWGLYQDAAIPYAFIDTVLEGSPIVVSGSFNPTCPDSMLVAGHPVIVGNSVLGAAIVSVSMAELEVAISGMYQITLVSLAVAAFFSLILIYISSRAIIRPLKQINQAAKVITMGGFENRIPVKAKDEVGQLAMQFNTMAESLYNQERIRREFISNLSHDIRTPLTSVLGFVKALEDGTIPIEEQPHYHGIILNETERLIKLSDDFLDIHRIQEAKLELTKTTFDINELIRTTILGFEQRAIAKQITVTSSFANVTNNVLADEDKIRRCLYNLLDNAIKFTQDEGAITVETVVKGRKVIVAVKDNGQGMTTEEQAQAYDRFYKGDQSRSEDKLGSGLGLSITKEFILAHGEAIDTESTPGKGSEFTFTLTRSE